MSSVGELYHITKTLYDHAKVPPQAEEREAYIERLTAMLEERAVILEGVKGEFSDDERALMKQAVDMNLLIEDRLQAELNHIKLDIGDLRKKKETGRRYENPYSYGPIDGAFIDKKN